MSGISRTTTPGAQQSDECRPEAPWVGLSEDEQIEMYEAFETTVARMEHIGDQLGAGFENDAQRIGLAKYAVISATDARRYTDAFSFLDPPRPQRPPVSPDPGVTAATLRARALRINIYDPSQVAGLAQAAREGAAVIEQLLERVPPTLNKQVGTPAPAESPGASAQPQ